MVILAYFKGVPREHPFYFSCFCVFSQETSENLSVFAFFKGVPREHPSFCICLELFFLPLAGSIGGSVEPPDVIQYKQNLSLAVFSRLHRVVQINHFLCPPHFVDGKNMIALSELPATYARHTALGSGGFGSVELLFSCLRRVKFTG